MLEIVYEGVWDRDMVYLGICGRSGVFFKQSADWCMVYVRDWVVGTYTQET